jgi:pyocin large subunit-like protein
MSSHEDDPLRLEMPEQKDEQEQEPWPLPLFRSNILTNMAGAGVPKTWGNPSGVPDHFVRHGADVGAKNAESYVDQASEFRKRSQTDGLPTKIDPKGTIRIYDPASNTFGAYNADGTTKTFFSLQAQHILIVSRASRQQPSRKEKDKDGSYVPGLWISKTERTAA